MKYSKSYFNTSIGSQFILSSFRRFCASAEGTATGRPWQKRLVFCFFGLGSSKVKSSSSTCSSFFSTRPESDDPSLAYLSVCWASETIKDSLYIENYKKKKGLKQNQIHWKALLIILKGRNFRVVNILTAVCLTSSLIILLGTLVVAGCSSGHVVCCFFEFPPAALFFFPSLFCFIFVPGKPDSAVFFTFLAVIDFSSPGGLSDPPGFGHLGSSGSLGWDLGAVLLTGFSCFDSGSLAALRIFVFASDGFHSSLSSSPLSGWEADLTRENMFGMIFKNNVDVDAKCRVPEMKVIFVYLHIWVRLAALYAFFRSASGHHLINKMLN